MQQSQSQSSCPFRKGYLIHPKTPQTPFHAPSKTFAQYVSHLDSLPIQTPRTKTQSTTRVHTLPQLPATPKLEEMHKRFVMASPKPHNTPIIHPRQYSLEMRKSIVIKPLQKLPRKSASNTMLDELESNVFYFRIGGAVVVDKLIEHFHSLSQHNTIISSIDDQDMYQSNFRTFLEFAFGKPVFYNLNTLRQKHIPLNLRNRDFNLFKSYLIEAFLKATKVQPEMMFEFAALIEQYRYVIITKEKTFAQIYNQKLESKRANSHQSVYYLARSTYSKIYADNTLAAYFQGVELEDQALKLSKILNQMMCWDTGNDDAIHYLRESHRVMQLTNVHFTLFKMFMIESMREIGIKDKQIEMVTQRMDGYRFCIINEDSLFNFFTSSTSVLSTYIKKYQLLMCRDSRMNNFCNPETILKHCHFIIYFITRQHLPTLTRTDIAQIHQRCPMQAEWFEAFRDNFFLLIKNINLHQSVIHDYQDIWFRLRFSLFGDCSIEKQIGKDHMDIIKYKLEMTLQDNDNYSHYFKNADYQIKFHIKRIMSFIFRNVQVYKSNDLRVIHSALRIKESTFDLFVYLIRQTMKSEQVAPQIIQQCECICMHYKQSICNL